MRGIGTAGACLLCAALIAACGQSGMQTADSQSAAATTTETAPPVSPAKLNPGRFATTPLPPFGKAGTPERGALVQAQQMADYVVGPWEVNKEMVAPYLDTYYVMGNATPLGTLGPPAIAQAAGKHGMINGFGSARQIADKATLLNSVLRFPDPAAAAAAAADMNAGAMAQPISGAQPEPLAIAGHDGTLASTYAFTPRDSAATRASVRAFTAHGPYVFMQFAQSVEGREAVTELVAKTVDRQTPLIDKFTPADVNALADVDVDPTGLLARTLPLPENEASQYQNAVYGPRGASHFQSNPTDSTTLFKDTGVTSVVMGGANVYEAKDNPTARFITNAFNGEVSSMEGATETSPVPEIPDSHCMAFPKAFYCVAPAGRYAIEIRAQKFEDAQQQVAAQYILLTAN